MRRGKREVWMTSVAEPKGFRRGTKAAVAVALTLVLSILVAYAVRSEPGRVSGSLAGYIRTLLPDRTRVSRCLLAVFPALRPLA
jgi:hypothetical protein